jgi:hypothetical protein
MRTINLHFELPRILHQMRGEAKLRRCRGVFRGNEIVTLQVERLPLDLDLVPLRARAATVSDEPLAAAVVNVQSGWQGGSSIAVEQLQKSCSGRSTCRFLPLHRPPEFCDECGPAPTPKTLPQPLARHFSDETIRSLFASSIETMIASRSDRSRNELCPCGSGKRYKHCHGALV